LVVLVPGFGLVVTDAEGSGAVDFPGVAELPEASGVVLTPGDRVVPSPPVALAPGEARPVPDGDTGSAGSGDESTLPAG
jgi:hypothetical protein